MSLEQYKLLEGKVSTGFQAIKADMENIMRMFDITEKAINSLHQRLLDLEGVPPHANLPVERQEDELQDRSSPLILGT